MKLHFWVMMALAFIAGALARELVVRCAVCRDILGRLAGHGHLVALVHQRGIYESDLKNGTSKEQLIAAQNVRWLSRNESVPKAMVDRDYDLIEQTIPISSWLSHCAFDRHKNGAPPVF